MKLTDIIKQLEYCEYKDDHGNPLELNIAFIALKSLQDRTQIPEFKPEDILWFMNKNKPTEIKISSSEIFNVDSNQKRIKYSAWDVENPVSWIDHQHLQEKDLFKTKELLLSSL